MQSYRFRGWIRLGYLVLAGLSWIHCAIQELACVEHGCCMTSLEPEIVVLA